MERECLSVWCGIQRENEQKRGGKKRGEGCGTKSKWPGSRCLKILRGLICFLIFRFLDCFCLIFFYSLFFLFRKHNIKIIKKLL